MVYMSMKYIEDEIWSQAVKTYAQNLHFAYVAF